VGEWFRVDFLGIVVFFMKNFGYKILVIFCVFASFESGAKVTKNTGTKLHKPRQNSQILEKTVAKNKGKLNDIVYEILTITENEILGKGVDFKYEFLVGRIGEFSYFFDSGNLEILNLRLNFDVNSKIFTNSGFFMDYYSQNLVYEIFRYDQAENWEIKFDKISLNGGEKCVENIDFFNKNGGKIFVNSLKYENFVDKNSLNTLKNADFKENSSQNTEFDSKNGAENLQKLTAFGVFVRPSDSPISWEAKVGKLEVFEDFVAFSDNVFGFSGAHIPWLNLTVGQNYSSGFCVPELKKDEVDGFLVSIPYYFFLDKSDVLFKPSFGASFSVHFNMRSLVYDGLLLNSRLDGRYFSFDQFERGGYFNIYTKNFAAETFVDLDLILATSRNYLRYFDKKENKTSRQFVNSHLYVMPISELRLGIGHFTNVQNGKNLLIPVAYFKRITRFDGVGIRTDFMVNSFICQDEFFADKEAKIGENMEKTELGKNEGKKLTKLSKINEKNEEKSSKAAKMADNAERPESEFIQEAAIHYETILAIVPEILVGKNLLSANQAGLHVISTKSGDMYKIFGISQSVFGYHTAGSAILAPYFDVKFSHIFRDRFKNDYNAISYSSIFNRDFGENIGYRGIENGAAFGVRSFVGSFELDSGFLYDRKGNLVFGGQYLFNKFFIYAKDFVSLESVQNHDLFVGIGLNYDQAMFLVDYGIVEFDKKIYSKISGKLNFKITDDILLNLEGVFGLKPVNYFIFGGVNLVYMHQAWRFSCGMTYGNESLDDNQENQIKFTFAVGLNGMDQFVGLYNRLSSLKVQELENESFADVFSRGK